MPDIGPNQWANPDRKSPFDNIQPAPQPKANPGMNPFDFLNALGGANAINQGGWNIFNQGQQAGFLPQVSPFKLDRHDLQRAGIVPSYNTYWDNSPGDAMWGMVGQGWNTMNQLPNLLGQSALAANLLSSGNLRAKYQPMADMRMSQDLIEKAKIEADTANRQTDAMERMGTQKNDMLPLLISALTGAMSGLGGGGGGGFQGFTTNFGQSAKLNADGAEQPASSRANPLFGKSSMFQARN